MNQLDMFIVAIFLSAAVGGYSLGFIARVASWIGLAIGLFVAVRLLPTVAESTEGADPTSRLFFIALILLGGGLGGQALGLALGARLKRFLPVKQLQVADRAVGAIAGGLGVLIIVWMLVPAMSDVPGWPAHQVRNSLLARKLSDVAPQPPDTLQALRRLVGEGNFPQVFSGIQPTPTIEAPPADSGIPAHIRQQVLFSTVKVEAIACDRIQEGSGFVAQTGLVATNAHVVAGSHDVDVKRTDGAKLDATVVMFDPDRDIALLRVNNLNRPALFAGEGDEGDKGAVFGHPGGQDPVRIAPAAVAEQIRATGRDIYDEDRTTRDVFILASALRQGDSGAPLVDTGGQVIGIAFAISPDQSQTAYALTHNELRAALFAPRTANGNTGRCLRD